MIDAHTTLYGLLGDPVAHSLGPVMHNAAFAVMGVNAAYLAFGVKDIAGAVAGLKALGMGGASVTLPYKTRVMDLLDDIDPVAARIGAVNTIARRQDKLVGFNTDGQGALDALEACTGVRGRRVALLGAGGAARAVGFAVTIAGAKLTVFNRDTVSGEKLARDLDADFAPLSAFGRRSCDIVINATSLGMFPHTGATPVDPALIRPETVVMDLVYNPRQTLLLTRAREKGCPIVEGLEMFVRQGAAQFCLWTGRTAPVDRMRGVVVAALEKGPS